MRRRLAILYGMRAVNAAEVAQQVAVVDGETAATDGVALGDTRLGPGVALAQEAEPAYDAQHPALLPGLLMRYRTFVVSACAGIAGLYAELGLFGYAYYRNDVDTGRAGLAIAALFLLTFLGYLSSLILPHLAYRYRYADYNPIVFFVKQFTLAVGIVVLTSLMTFGLSIVIVGADNYGAMAEMLRSLFLYTIVGALVFHGLITYIRYVQYLYLHQIHESYKIVALAGGMSFGILVVALYLLPFDLGRIGADGLLALHLSVRDVALLGLTLYIFIWHALTLADH